MTSSEPFLPIIYIDRCDGCGDCVKVCPSRALELVAGFATLVTPDNCAYCADCEEHCPQRAIALPYEIVADRMD
jgi:NAD-dependent dihydropyrimidine dehydrogenase PreA subunit